MGRAGAGGPGPLPPGMRPLLTLVGAVVFIDTALYAALAPILADLRDEFGLGKAGAAIRTSRVVCGVHRHSPRSVCRAMSSAWSCGSS